MKQEAIDFIEKYNNQYIAELTKLCKEFMLIGTEIESPRWIQYKGFIDINTSTIHFRSSQVSHVGFSIKIDEEHVEDFMFEYSVAYNHFKKLRNDLLLNSFPTIT